MNKKKELAIHEKDTGSSEVQVAQLTDKIENLSKHIKNNKKDKHSSVGLKGDELKAIHPVVRTHPETKRKSLYINEAHTTHFVGMTVEESEPILQYLFKHQIKSEFTCRFQWEKGSVAIWDNRCTMHYPINDYHGFRRLMHRITFEGDKPY